MNRFVKIISTKADDIGRRLVKSLGWGKDDVQETKVASSFGDDSNPVENMVAVYSPTSDIGNPVIIGYINKNQIADIGEKRIFSTDSDGNVVFAIHLKNDGTAEIGGNSDFLVRFNELESGFNQIKSDLNDLVSAFNSHMHATAATGPPVPPTPIPSQIPATPSTASISGAKIEEIKTL